MIDAKTIEERTKPLLEEALDLEAAKEETQIKNPPDPKSQKQYSFHVRYVDAGGEIWEGDFTNKILSIKDRQLVGVIRARLGGGLPAGTLDPLTEEINLMAAHMGVSLVKRPKWADDLQALDCVRLLQAIYKEVASHEAKFQQWGDDQA